jgi:hypothetical protein
MEIINLTHKNYIEISKLFQEKREKGFSGSKDTQTAAGTHIDMNK